MKTTTLKRLATPTPTKYRIAEKPRVNKTLLKDNFGKYPIT